MRLLDLVLGRPIPTADDDLERVGPIAGVGVLGLDALASAAYGPEALLTALRPLGSEALGHVSLLIGVIIGLLLLVGASYAQTIQAYPNGGGAYTVAKENLGTRASLVAAAALAMDYILNVAVAISAGVAALASAVPAVLPHTLPLCLGLLGLLTLINLRGVRSAGLAVLLPTYAFVACLLLVLAIGVFSSAPVRAHATAAAGGLGPAGWALVWLLLQAFANGCTAMTGVEAVSNGVPIFKKPSVVGARRTLALIVGLLVTLLAGIGFVARKYSITATPPGQSGYESVLSQLAHATLGDGAAYYVAMGSIFIVLGLSANTSFADFPRVCRVLAFDKFLPEPFVHRGRRLVFSQGIWVLTLLSAILLVAFQGVTDHLIPLFALGALSAFTMSQAGMVAHWRRRRGRRARAAGALNLLGALGTGLTLLVVLTSKLGHGAWISVLLVLGMLALFRAVRRHYDFVARATETGATLEVGPLDAPVAIVPIRRWDAVSLKALLVAAGMSREVVVVQILTGDREVDDLTTRWGKLVDEPARRLGFPAPRLIVEHSPFRDIFAPFLRVVDDMTREHRGRPVAVFVPELVEPRWYHYLLHGQTAALLRQKLRARGGPQVVLVSTPWHVRDWLPERSWLRSLSRRWWPRRAGSDRAPSSALR